jgi:hypothetical protein
MMNWQAIHLFNFLLWSIADTKVKASIASVALVSAMRFSANFFCVRVGNSYG